MATRFQGSRTKQSAGSIPAREPKRPPEIRVITKFLGQNEPRICVGRARATVSERFRINRHDRDLIRCIASSRRTAVCALFRERAPTAEHTFTFSSSLVYTVRRRRFVRGSRRSIGNNTLTSCAGKMWHARRSVFVLKLLVTSCAHR